MLKNALLCLVSLWGPALLFSVCSASDAADPPLREPVAKVTGDPYDLRGKKIVFTNWYYVRPGSYAWKDRAGKVVTANTDAKLGPWDAKFERRDVPRGIRIVAQPAQRSGPLTALAHLGESKNISVRTLLDDESTYRLWASYGNVNGQNDHPCVFESKDGLHWKTPRLGLVAYAGNTENNLLASCPETIFKDVGAIEAERYKGVSIERISQEEFTKFKQRRPNGWERRAERKDAGNFYAIRGYVSRDGLTWKQLPDPLVVEHSDTRNIAYYDPDRRKYVLYTRTYDVGPRSGRAPADVSGMSWLGDTPGAGRRSIGRSESASFREFPVSKLILVPGPEMLPSELLYTNCRTAIPGAPDHHLMFPAIWDTNGDTTKMVMASSHDGAIWNYVPGGPVLQTSNFGNWDGGAIFASPDLVEFPNGTFVLPYRGYSVPHKYPRGQWKYQIGFALWPKGRIVALEAEEKGEFATVAIMPPGRKLRINAVTQRAGHILVEVADLQGKPLPGRTFDDVEPIQGDQYRALVNWKGSEDLGYKEGQPIVLRFRMDQANLFGLEFE